MHSLQHLSRVFQSQPIPELLLQVEQAKKPKQLTRAVNKVQHRLWNLPKEEQVIMHKRRSIAYNQIPIPSCVPLRKVQYLPSRG
jgi:hypothetical protein